jgi:hypothetical protein
MNQAADHQSGVAAMAIARSPVDSVPARLRVERAFDLAEAATNVLSGSLWLLGLLSGFDALPARFVPWSSAGYPAAALARLAFSTPVGQH